jgi:hypothetical protein
MQAGELRVWLHTDAVRVELLVSQEVLPSSESAASVYDTPLFDRLGARVAVEESEVGMRVSFVLDAAAARGHSHAPAGNTQAGAAPAEP